MAIVEKESKRYLKILSDRCKFEKNAVTIYALVFESKEHRDIYYKRIEELENLRARYFNKKSEINEEYYKFVNSLENPSAESIAQNIPAELKDRIENFQKLENKFLEYCLRGYAQGLTEWQILKEIGFTKSMSTAIIEPTGMYIDVGPYKGQTFEPRCLYTELKKLYPWDAIEDI